MIPVSQKTIKEFTDKGYWGEETLLDLMREHARIHPDAEAIADPDNRPSLIGGDPKRFTYAEMLRAIDRLAAGFEGLGIGRDDVIIVQLPNVTEAILSYFAAARIGAISSPLPMMARAHELSHAFGLTAARAIVTVPRFHGFNHEALIRDLQKKYPGMAHMILAGPGIPEGELSMERMLSEPVNTAVPEQAQSGPNDIFTICWTSGTEAEPKGVPHTHNEWLAIGRVVVEGCQMTPGFNIHGSFPVINMSSFGGLLTPWVITGGKFVLHHPFDQAVFFSQLANEKIDFTLMPPALLDTLAKSAKGEAMGKLRVKLIGSGSTPLSPWMVRHYQEEHGIGIVNFFASNEGVAFFSPPRFFPEPEDRAIYFPRFGGEGIQWDVPENVVGGMRSKLVNPDTGEEITRNGEVGELCFAGPTVFSGYWRRPELTRKAFDKDGYYRTGDLFTIEGKKRDRYRFKGRFKDIIIRGGQNISSEEVETLISAHPHIKEVAVVGYPDERLGERSCAVVVPLSPETITLEDITRFLESEGVARYKFPERLELVDSLPRSPLQKVLRRKLRETLRRKIGMEGL